MQRKRRRWLSSLLYGVLLLFTTAYTVSSELTAIAPCCTAFAAGMLLAFALYEYMEES